MAESCNSFLRFLEFVAMNAGGPFEIVQLVEPNVANRSADQPGEGSGAKRTCRSTSEPAMATEFARL